jgi:hypothetical protein
MRSGDVDGEVSRALTALNFRAPDYRYRQLSSAMSRNSPGNWAITWSSCSSPSISCSVVNTARTPSVVSRTVSPVCSHELIEAEFLGNRSSGAEGLVQRLGELPRKVAALARAESVGQRPQCRPGEICRFFAGQGRALRHGPSEFLGLHVGPLLCWRRMGVPSSSPTMRPITRQRSRAGLSGCRQW